MNRFLGIDFSGNHLMWRPGCGRSNVWISDVRKTGERLVLDRLMRVQEIPGDEHPLERLAALLREGDFEAAAIDAPFSVPKAFITPECYAGLLERIGSLSDPDGRPYCRAADFVKTVAGVDPPLNPPKPTRSTDAYWSQNGLNVGATLWAGARGGAAMAAAFFKLLHRAQRPICPWVQESRGLLLEVFPMAQLKQWVSLTTNTSNRIGRENCFGRGPSMGCENESILARSIRFSFRAQMHSTPYCGHFLDSQ